MKIGAVIVAGGRGGRLGKVLPKAFVCLGERPLYRYSLETFLEHPLVAQTVLVVPEEYAGECQRGVPQATVVCGGVRRQDSVEKGLYALAGDISGVLIHDAARPFVSPVLIDRLIAELREGRNAIAALPIADTVKEVEGGKIARTVDRKTLWCAQTPQAFSVSQLKEAFAMAHQHQWEATDEAVLIEKSGGSVYCVEGDARNLKITTPADWELAEGIVRGRS